MKLEDWFILSTFSSAMGMILPFLLIFSFFGGCVDMVKNSFDPSSIESPQEEFKKLGDFWEDLREFQRNK